MLADLAIGSINADKRQAVTGRVRNSGNAEGNYGGRALVMSRNRYSVQNDPLQPIEEKTNYNSSCISASMTNLTIREKGKILKNGNNRNNHQMTFLSAAQRSNQNNPFSDQFDHLEDGDDFDVALGGKGSTLL